MTFFLTKLINRDGIRYEGLEEHKTSIPKEITSKVPLPKSSLIQLNAKEDDGDRDRDSHWKTNEHGLEAHVNIGAFGSKDIRNIVGTMGIEN